MDLGAQSARRRAGPYRERSQRERHGADTSWFEWTLRELLRYSFGVLVLAVIIVLPLQMEDSWNPPGGQPVVDPSAVGASVVAVVVGTITIAIFAYRYVWGDGGWVDREVARHESVRH